MANDLSMAVDGRVTPALHPNVVQASIEDYDDDTAGHLEQVVNAFSQAYQVIGHISDARDAVQNDLTLTAAARVLAVADVADKVMARATSAFDKASANMKSAAAAIEQQLLTPVKQQASQQISGEVREHAKGLTTGSRMTFVTEAINRGDADTVCAVLGAPPYLSGLTPDMQTVLLRMWNEKAQPLLSKRLRAYKAASDLLDRNGPLVLKGITEAVGVYTDPASKRKYRPDELRAMKKTSAAAFARLGGE